MVGLFGVKINENLNRAQKNDQKKSNRDFFLAKYELQHTVIYTVFLHFSSYLNGCLYLYYPMLLSRVLIQLAMTNNLCTYQMSFLENLAGPKMGRQILGEQKWP